MLKYLALDSRGWPLVCLEVESYQRAVRYVFQEHGVLGAVDLIGYNADSDIKATEAELVAAFQAGGLTEKEARIAARGRDRGVTHTLRTVHVPTDDAGATTRSSSTVRISERESQERELRSVELHEPGSIDLASDGLTELKERGVQNSGTEALYRAFRADGMPEKAAMVAARGRDYGVELPRIREDSQAMGEETPIAYARRMEFPTPDGSVGAQWKIDCPWCRKMHLNPDPPTTQDIGGMLGPQAMLCRLGDANVVDAATNPPPEPKTTKTLVPSGEAARDELARAEASLYEAFLRGGLTETEAKVAARGRDRR